MLPVLVRVEAEAEALNELMEDALGVSGASLTAILAGLLHALHEINYCSFVDVEEEFGHSELNLRVNGPVLFHYLGDEELLHLLDLRLVGDWTVVRRRLVPFFIEEDILLPVLRRPHLLELLEVPAVHLFAHLVLADSAPVLRFPALHPDRPFVTLGALEFHVHFAGADDYHFEGALMHLNGPFDGFMDLVAVGAELASNMHFRGPEPLLAVNAGCPGVTASLDLLRLLCRMRHHWHFKPHVCVIFFHFSMPSHSDEFCMFVFSFKTIIRSSSISIVRILHIHHESMHMMSTIWEDDGVLMLVGGSSSLPVLVSRGLLLGACSILMDHLKDGCHASGLTLRNALERIPISHFEIVLLLESIFLTTRLLYARLLLDERLGIAHPGGLLLLVRHSCFHSRHFFLSSSVISRCWCRCCCCIISGVGGLCLRHDIFDVDFLTCISDGGHIIEVGAIGSSARHLHRNWNSECVLLPILGGHLLTALGNVLFIVNLWAIRFPSFGNIHQNLNWSLEDSFVFFGLVFVVLIGSSSLWWLWHWLLLLWNHSDASSKHWLLLESIHWVVKAIALVEVDFESCFGGFGF